MKEATSDFWSIVEAAVRAPSSHNSQPWVFELATDEIVLRADRTRALPVNDPFDRELTISCGAALFNLETAASALGYQCEVSTLPDAADPDMLATVTLHKVAELRHSQLFEAIEGRSSTRGALAAPSHLVDLPAVLEALTSAASDHRVTLTTDIDRFVLGSLVADGDRMQFDDPHWRRELASWLHPRRKGDGMVVPEVLGLANKAVVSLVDLGPSAARSDRSLIMEAPIVAVLSTSGDQAADWLEAGRALEHLLLVAADLDLLSGFENQPCQVRSLRGKLREILPGGRFPQVVVRFGIGTEPRRNSPRRPVEEVILLRDLVS